MTCSQFFLIKSKTILVIIIIILEINIIIEIFIVEVIVGKSCEMNSYEFIVD